MGSRAEWIWERKNICELEGRKIEITQSGQQKENKLKWSEQSVWDNNKRYNICINRILEGEGKEYRTKRFFKEIIVENFPDLVKQ